MPARWLVLVLVAGFGVSCGSKAEDSGGPDVDCSRRPALDWHNFGKGFMDKHCNGCHSVLVPDEWRQGAPAGVDFNTYGDVLEWTDRIWARGTRAVVEEPTMPPGGGPSTLELDRLEEWLSCEVALDKAALAEAR